MISAREHSTTHRHAQVDDALIEQQTRQIRRRWPSTVATALSSLHHDLLSAAAWPDHAAAAARPAAGQAPLLRAVGLHGPARS
jgi:hypothetical protein